MKYPKLENYRKLYARYLSDNGRHVSQLLDLAADNFNGGRILDLCGGGGEIALAARDRGAGYVLIIDNCKKMVDYDILKSKVIEYGAYHVAEWLHDEWYTWEPFDYVFCRQAVNYWLDEDAAEDLSKIMLTGGVFVFNTFNKKPSPNPKVKQYVFEGVEFVEVSWLGADDMVHHVQCREGMRPHMTSFKWISPEQYMEWLSPWFEVATVIDGNTTLYRCKKK